MGSYGGNNPGQGEVILQRWTYHSHAEATLSILPDGCRDLLYWIIPGRDPFWTVSPLQRTAMTAAMGRETRLVGYRLSPGVEVSDRVLSELGAHSGDDPDESVSRILGLIGRDRRVEEALSAVATLPASVADVALLLGVSARTLERLLLGRTGATPVFWTQLVRVRAAARYLAAGERFVEVALRAGYADQAHLSRSVRRWFGVSPGELVHRSDLVNQLASPGYDAVTGEQISTRYPSGSLT